MSHAKPTSIRFTRTEISSGLDRVRLAELLILQLPETHEGRNTWLMHYGRRKYGQQLRTNHGLPENLFEHLANGIDFPAPEEIKDTLVVNTETNFSWKDRFRIFFGWRQSHMARVELKAVVGRPGIEAKAMEARCWVWTPRFPALPQTCGRMPAGKAAEINKKP